MPNDHYRYDDRAGRYRNPEGDLLDDGEVRRALDATLDVANRRVNRLTEQLKAGEITPTQWEDAMRTETKSLHLYSGALAKGGWSNMEEADFGRVGGFLKRQYLYLNNFGKALRQGRLPIDNRLNARARLYVEAARRTFSTMDRIEKMRRGYNEERNLLGPSDHCGECSDLTRQGWVPIGTLKMVGLRICLANCRCIIEYRDRTPRDKVPDDVNLAAWATTSAAISVLGGRTLSMHLGWINRRVKTVFGTVDEDVLKQRIAEQVINENPDIGERPKQILTDISMEGAARADTAEVQFMGVSARAFGDDEDQFLEDYIEDRPELFEGKSYSESLELLQADVESLGYTDLSQWVLDQLSLVDPIDSIATYKYRVRGVGQVNVDVSYRTETGNISIDWFGSPNRAEKLRIGRSAVRHIFAHTLEQYPGARTVSAERISGARAYLGLAPGVKKDLAGVRKVLDIEDEFEQSRLAGEAAPDHPSVVFISRVEVKGDDAERELRAIAEEEGYDSLQDYLDDSEYEGNLEAALNDMFSEGLISASPGYSSFVFDVRGKQLQIAARYNADNKILTVDWVGDPDRKNRVDVGPEIRRAFAVVLEAFPDATKLTAIRVSGARKYLGLDQDVKKDLASIRRVLGIRNKEHQAYLAQSAFPRSNASYAPFNQWNQSEQMMAAAYALDTTGDANQTVYQEKVLRRYEWFEQELRAGDPTTQNYKWLSTSFAALDNMSDSELHAMSQIDLYNYIRLFRDPRAKAPRPLVQKRDYVATLTELRDKIRKSIIEEHVGVTTSYDGEGVLQGYVIFKKGASAYDTKLIWMAVRNDRKERGVGTAMWDAIDAAGISPMSFDPQDVTLQSFMKAYGKNRNKPLYFFDEPPKQFKGTTQAQQVVLLRNLLENRMREEGEWGDSQEIATLEKFASEVAEIMDAPGLGWSVGDQYYSNLDAPWIFNDPHSDQRGYLGVATWQGQIGLSKKTTSDLSDLVFLTKHRTQSSLRDIARPYSGTDAAASAFSTLIHELNHMRSRTRWTGYEHEGKKYGHSPLASIVEEGIVERRARIMTLEVFNGKRDGYLVPTGAFHGAYQREVEFIDWYGKEFGAIQDVSLTEEVKALLAGNKWTELNERIADAKVDKVFAHDTFHKRFKEMATDLRPWLVKQVEAITNPVARSALLRHVDAMTSEELVEFVYHVRPGLAMMSNPDNIISHFKTYNPTRFNVSRDMAESISLGPMMRDESQFPLGYKVSGNIHQDRLVSFYYVNQAGVEVGNTTISKRPDGKWEIEDIDVLPQYRRKGIGVDIYDQLARFAAQHKIHIYTVEQDLTEEGRFMFEFRKRTGRLASHPIIDYDLTIEEGWDEIKKAYAEDVGLSHLSEKEIFKDLVSTAHYSTVAWARLGQTMLEKFIFDPGSLTDTEVRAYTRDVLSIVVNLMDDMDIPVLYRSQYKINLPEEAQYLSIAMQQIGVRQPQDLPLTVDELKRATFYQLGSGTGVNTSFRMELDGRLFFIKVGEYGETYKDAAISEIAREWGPWFENLVPRATLVETRTSAAIAPVPPGQAIDYLTRNVVGTFRHHELADYLGIGTNQLNSLQLGRPTGLDPRTDAIVIEELNRVYERRRIWDKASPADRLKFIHFELPDEAIEDILHQAGRSVSRADLEAIWQNRLRFDALSVGPQLELKKALDEVFHKYDMDNPTPVKSRLAPHVPQDMDHELVHKMEAFLGRSLTPREKKTRVFVAEWLDNATVMQDVRSHQRELTKEDDLRLLGFLEKFFGIQDRHEYNRVFVDDYRGHRIAGVDLELSFSPTRNHIYDIDHERWGYPNGASDLMDWSTGPDAWRISRDAVKLILEKEQVTIEIMDRWGITPDAQYLILERFKFLRQWYEDTRNEVDEDTYKFFYYANADGRPRQGSISGQLPPRGSGGRSDSPYLFSDPDDSGYGSVIPEEASEWAILRAEEDDPHGETRLVAKFIAGWTPNWVAGFDKNYLQDIEVDEIHWLDTAQTVAQGMIHLHDVDMGTVRHFTVQWHVDTGWRADGRPMQKMGQQAQARTQLTPSSVQIRPDQMNDLVHPVNLIDGPHLGTVYHIMNLDGELIGDFVLAPGQLGEQHVAVRWNATLRAWEQLQETDIQEQWNLIGWRQFVSQDHAEAWMRPGLAVVRDNEGLWRLIIDNDRDDDDADWSSDEEGVNSLVTTLNVKSISINSKWVDQQIQEQGESTGGPSFQDLTPADKPRPGEGYKVVNIVLRNNAPELRNVRVQRIVNLEDYWGFVGEIEDPNPNGIHPIMVNWDPRMGWVVLPPQHQRVWADYARFEFPEYKNAEDYMWRNGLDADNVEIIDYINPFGFIRYRLVPVEEIGGGPINIPRPQPRAPEPDPDIAKADKPKNNEGEKAVNRVVLRNGKELNNWLVQDIAIIEREGIIQGEVIVRGKKVGVEWSEISGWTQIDEEYEDFWEEVGRTIFRNKPSIEQALEGWAAAIGVDWQEEVRIVEIVDHLGRLGLKALPLW